MIVRNMIFEAEIIEQRRFPSFQTSHHGAFLPRLFLRGNHRRQIKTTIFSASASALCTDVVLFCNGTFSPTFKNSGEKVPASERQQTARKMLVVASNMIVFIGLP